jgi:hypothetical protein
MKERNFLVTYRWADLSPLSSHRLFDLWKETQNGPDRDPNTNPSSSRKRTLVDIMGLNDDQEGEGGVNAGEDAEIVREPWMQTALALLGKPVNTPISELVESDFKLPERLRGRLSTYGKVRRTEG